MQTKAGETYQEGLSIDHITEALISHESCETGMLHPWLLQLHHQEYMSSQLTQTILCMD